MPIRLAKAKIFQKPNGIHSCNHERVDPHISESVHCKDVQIRKSKNVMKVAQVQSLSSVRRGSSRGLGWQDRPGSPDVL
jgi:hypothetical protein